MLINIPILQKFQFNIPTDNIENTKYYEALISSASSIITNYIGMDFNPTTYIEYIDEIKGGKYLVVKRVPVINIEELKVDEELYTEDYSVENKTGIVRFQTPLAENKDVIVTYTAGYADVPQDIQYACVELVQYLKKRISNSLVGESSKNIDGGSITIETSMPLNVIHICNRYKWKNICV